jgi:hypothetical protein
MHRPACPPSPFRRVSLSLAATCLAFLAGASAAGAVTLSAIADQNGFNGYIGASGAAFTALPFDFSAQNYTGLGAIDALTLTLRINDGDTSHDAFDFGQLTLALDGIDTGILLNGFRNNKTDTRTFTSAPANADAILAALRLDGRLNPSVLDRSPNDNLVLFPANFKATLSITGTPVPEPASAAGVVGLGALMLAMRLRRNGPDAGSTRR